MSDITVRRKAKFPNVPSLDSELNSITEQVNKAFRDRSGATVDISFYAALSFGGTADKKITLKIKDGIIESVEL